MVKERVSLEDFPLYSRDGSNKLTEEQVGGGLGVECFKNGARWKNLNVLIPSKLNLNCFDKSVLGESWNKRRYSTHIYINKRITREYKKNKS